MINPFQEINWKPDKKAVQEFGRSLIIGGAVLLGVATLYRIGFAETERKPFIFQMIFALIMILGFIAQVLPTCSKPVYYVWFFIGACIGIVVSNLILILFYFLFFTPIAIIVRCNGRDPLGLKQSSNKSNWLPHKVNKDPKRYYRQY